MDGDGRRRLTIQETANLLGRHRGTIRRAADDGTLPIVRVGRSRVLLPAGDAEVLGQIPDRPYPAARHFVIAYRPGRQGWQPSRRSSALATPIPGDATQVPAVVIEFMSDREEPRIAA
ncbi:MAG TPA: excisionase family DNA-binding protein [Thermomicrobiales bacterium]|nr:excisionase family DNA-binding protein [Thermomicrobiales bacterium]